MKASSSLRKRLRVDEQPQVADIGFSNTALYGLNIFPLEIWDTIFSLLLVNPAGITKRDLRRRRVPGVPPVPVMQVCKAWYQRAQFIFYARNDFHFDKLSHMTTALKRMALDSRRALRSVEVSWSFIWGVEGNEIPHELTQCTSLQTVRMAFPHIGGVFANIGMDVTETDSFGVIEEMRGLKEISIRCPGNPGYSLDMNAQVDPSLLGTEPTTEGQNEAVVKTTRKRKLKDQVETVTKRKPKGQMTVPN